MLMNKEVRVILAEAKQRAINRCSTASCLWPSTRAAPVEVCSGCIVRVACGMERVAWCVVWRLTAGCVAQRMLQFVLCTLQQPYISGVLPERLLRKLSQVRTMLLKVQVLRTCHSQNRCPYNPHYQYYSINRFLSGPAPLRCACRRTLSRMLDAFASYRAAVQPIPSCQRCPRSKCQLWRLSSPPRAL